jgi:hypothetical protein
MSIGPYEKLDEAMRQALREMIRHRTAPAIFPDLAFRLAMASAMQQSLSPVQNGGQVKAFTRGCATSGESSECPHPPTLHLQEWAWKPGHG